ncbi:hypothetical protein FKM82_004775 [Ascaphus truei]
MERTSCAWKGMFWDDPEGAFVLQCEVFCGLLNLQSFPVTQDYFLTREGFGVCVWFDTSCGEPPYLGTYAKNWHNCRHQTLSYVL